MKRNPESRTVNHLVRRYRKKKLNLRPDYQRGFVWSNKQKRMLIDTILRDMDIPKIYIREVSKGGYEGEVVDGQQRLRAVIDFCEGKFKTEPGKINGKEIGTVTYEELDEIDDDLREQFDAYEFSVVVLRDSIEDEVEEMFLRLQSGTSLNAQEKRNAKSGKMRDFIRDLATHEFFKKCGFNDRRFAYAHIASQMMMLELEGGPHSIRNVDLDKMYEAQNAKFPPKSTVAKEICKTLSCLAKAFLTKTPELEKHSAISMFLLFRYLRKNYVIAKREKEIAKWFVGFEKIRIEDAKKSTDKRDNELIEYQDKTGHATDSAESLEYRQKVLRARLLMDIPNMLLLDEKRSFTEDQRRAIWRRDEGICQITDKCDGKRRLEWDDNWHADHKKPWSAGGKTSVENGQVACAACNLAKGGRQ